MRPCAPLLRAVVALLAALAATIAGPSAAGATPPPEGRILGGQAAAPGAWPHQAYVQIDYGTGSGASCGGTIIAASWVVTAAHCVTLPSGAVASPGAVTVFVGKSQRSAFTGADRHAVDRLERNPAFTTATYASDVAVLHLVKATDLAQARLPRPQDAAGWAPGLRGTVLGWGRTTNDPSDHGTDALQQLDVPIVADAACTTAYGADYAASTMLCAGGEAGRDTCAGDSGGPLLTGDHMLVGLTSFGPPTCGLAGVPAVYTRVGADPVNAWIRDRVPQAEIDVSPAVPQPGQLVTLTSASRNPGGAYTSLTWDLNGDGQYDDATGPTASIVVPEGHTTVSLQAADASGDRERRTIGIDAVRSPIAFTVGAVTVTEGQPAVLTVAKAGGGTGTVQPVTESATATAGQDFAAALPLLSFAPADTAQVLTVPTVDDATDEPTEAFTVRLGTTSPGLTEVAPAAVAVTVLDNDPTPAPRVRILRVQVTRKAVTVSASTSKAGRFALLVRPSRRTRTLASSHRTATRGGTFTLKARLTKSGRSALRRGRHDVRISVTLAAKGAKAVTKAVHLKAPGIRRLDAHAAAACRNLKGPSSLRASLRAAHERAVGSARDGAIAKSSVFYGGCGTTRYAIATFSKAVADQPEKFRKRAGKRWEDAGDGFEDGCSASARKPVPAALVTAWRTCRG